MDKIPISVIMSVYNDETYISESIESILNQSYSDFEFIIINDGSTDKSLSIIEKYMGIDDRIRLINQENNGLTYSLNKGIKIAGNEYIARQDADDISLHLRFEKQLQYLLEHSKTAVVGTYCQIIDENGKLIVKQNIESTSSDEIKKNLPIANQLNHGSVMLRKSQILDVGGYRDEFLYGQDYDLWLRVIQKYDISNLDSILYCRRVHLDCIGVEFGKIQYEFGKIIKKYYRQRVNNGFDDLDRGRKEEIENLLKLEDSNGKHSEHKRLVNIGHYYFSLNMISKARHYFFKSIRIKYSFKILLWVIITFSPKFLRKRLLICILNITLITTKVTNWFK